MTRDLHEKLGSVTPENLFAGLEPRALTGAGTIAHGGAAAEFKRGSLMEKGTDGKLYLFGTNAAGEVTEDFNGDGTATTFTLSASPLPAAVKGAKVGTTDATVSSYNAQTGVVTLSSAPAAGTKNVHITYDKAGVNSPDCVLAEDITVGTTNDENALVYIGGCFNEDELILAENASISEADRDVLRMKGIILKGSQTENVQGGN